MSKERVLPGKYVSIIYSMREEDGDLVEQHDLPVGFVYGSDTELIGGMDRAIANRSVDEVVEVRVSPEDGFGERDPSLTFTDDLENVPEQFRHIGAEVQMQNERGETKTFFVSRIEDGKLTLDGNHPLAGKTLIVSVTIKEIRDALPGEAESSGIHSQQMQGPTTIN